MLKHIKVQNIILVDAADIEFNEGLNILTGETGSGKSAIMHAIGLIMGERADTTILRKGSERGVVEGIFDAADPALLQLLEEGGIHHSIGDDLIIKREITITGKGRIAINNQAAQLTFLKKIGAYLVQIVSQHAAQSLLSLDYHRESLDLFSDTQTILLDFQTAFKNEVRLEQELTTLRAQESQRLRDCDQYERELQEIEEAKLNLGEEEELFSEYTLLVNAEEMTTKIVAINDSLSGERQSVIAHLNKQKHLLNDLLRLDNTLEETVKAHLNALLELQEVSYFLLQYQQKQYIDPHRLEFVNERLRLINQLKKKYGPEIADVLNTKRELSLKLSSLQNTDEQINDLEENLKHARILTLTKAQELTEIRKSHAAKLQDLMTKELHSLNMTGAVFHVEVEAHKRSLNGDDKIEFFLSPNVGEHRISLKEKASGGEVSRVLLALRTILANKEKTSTLIFDEVDGNIGGETASIIGDKLVHIAKKHQVICITHFPQVAKKARHHIQVSKEEKEGRTHTRVNLLDSKSRDRELTRMAGIK